MKQKFKVGDKVICVKGNRDEGEFNQLIKGKEYEIMDIKDGYIIVNNGPRRNRYNDIGDWLPGRFKLVKEKFIFPVSRLSKVE